MALDQEYYEKALEILKSKGFSDNEADQIATTLSVYLPMRFIDADEWARMPYDQHPVNQLAFERMAYLDRIPELKKPVIYQMPTDFTYTTYGQEYEPGADSPIYTTGPDGYTHHPVGWESGITGESGVMGPAGDDSLEVSNLTYHYPSCDFKYRVPSESMLRRFTVVMKIGGKVSEVSLEELIEKMGGYDKLPASARAAIDHVMEAYYRTPVELGGSLEGAMPTMSIRTPLPGGVSQGQADYLKLNDLSNIEGIKRAYPLIDEESAERLSSMHVQINQRLGRLHRERHDVDVFDMLSGEPIKEPAALYPGSLFEKFLPDEPVTEPEGMTVKIRTHSIRNFGHGLQISTPLFGQSYKNPTGPQTMPGLEKGLNGKPQRRKKGKGKRYERGY